MRSILFVDDEKAILRSLKRLFFGQDWELYFAESGAEALSILSEHSIDMVISDMRMPNMDGHTLLKEVQRLYPHTIRLILSGFSDEKEIYQAVLDGSAKSYLLKPWEPKQLLDYLSKLFDLRDSLVSENIIDYVENIKSIPTFESIADEIGRMVERDASAAEIAAVIELDPGISARILQLVNSSSYDNKVASIKQASYQIGNRVLKNIITDREYTRCIKEDSEFGRHYRLAGLHTVITHRVVDLIYRNFLGKETPKTAAAASALHNIGRFIPIEDEDRHDIVGGYLLKWWGIPDPIVECALYHHRPLSASEENKELVGVLHLASYFACELLEVNKGEIDEKIFEILKIDQELYKQFIRGVMITGGLK